MRLPLTVVFVVFLLTISAQNDNDDRLLSHFSQSQIDKMAQSVPETLKFWEFYLTSGYHIAPYNPIKHDGELGVIDLSGEVDLFAMKLLPQKNMPIILRDPNLDLVLTVYPMKTLLAKFENANKPVN